MESKDKESGIWQSSGVCRCFFFLFCFALSHAWLSMFILASFSLENGPQLGTYYHCYTEYLHWVNFF